VRYQKVLKKYYYYEEFILGLEQMFDAGIAAVPVAVPVAVVDCNNELLNAFSCYSEH
jgi:hypothetical protein